MVVPVMWLVYDYDDGLLSHNFEGGLFGFFFFFFFFLFLFFPFLFIFWKGFLGTNSHFLY